MQGTRGIVIELFPRCHSIVHLADYVRPGREAAHGVRRGPARILPWPILRVIRPDGPDPAPDGGGHAVRPRALLVA
jgi:hypothetical protein